MSKPRLLIALLLVLSACSSHSGTGPASASSSDPNSFTPPKDAQFTIFCARVTGAGHVEKATRVRDKLKQSTDMKDWYVIIENEQTTLYYGFYKSIDEKKAQEDRRKISGMADQMGTRLFTQAVFVELSAPDPAAPPEWNLLNASGVYTLQIGVYRGNPQRKEAAVESVRQARAQGIEAYYYHGEAASLVCVGSWPASAMKISENSMSSGSNDPSQPIIVAPMTSDPGINEMYENAAKQNNAKLIRQQVQILDPTLEQALKTYPYNSVNGTYIKRTIGGKEVFDHSLIWGIPKTKKANPGSPALADQQQYDPNYRPNIPRQTAPTPPAQPSSGRLRSIGD